MHKVGEAASESLASAIDNEYRVVQLRKLALGRYPGQ